MSPGKFAFLLGGTVLGTALVAAAVIHVATYREGFHHAWAWRVNLADASRAWAVWILEPGREWELVDSTDRAYGRDYAISRAIAIIDSRRG